MLCQTFELMLPVSCRRRPAHFPCHQHAEQENGIRLLEDKAAGAIWRWMSSRSTADADDEPIVPGRYRIVGGDQCPMLRMSNVSDC